MERIKTRVLPAILRDLRTQFACPTEGYTSKFITGYWAKQSFPLVKAVVDRLDVQPAHAVLEIGYGCGHGLEIAHKRIGSGSGYVVGIEASSFMDSLAQKKFILEISEQGNLYLDQIPNLAHLPYPNNTFDSIYHVDVFYFWDGRLLPRVVPEFLRILKPGGRLLCGMEMKRLKTIESQGILTAPQYDPLRYTESLEPSGFTDVKIDYAEIAPSREGVFISGLKPNIDPDSEDPEVKMRELEQRIKAELALESLVSSKREMSAEMKQKLSDSMPL
uniref:phosphoethanolamine N-methyltransferase n=1 Tax=Panagrellus redivivus TaxID=6233 RepID=A0A7E4ZWK6_PANRE